MSAHAPGPGAVRRAGTGLAGQRGAENVVEFGAALRGEGALTEYLDGEAAGLRAVSGADVAEALGGLVSPAGKAALTGEFAGFIASAFRTAVSEGIAGWRDDDLAFARDWGFFVGIAAPSLRVAIWQGDQDRMVPFAHGQWLAANIPGARSPVPGEGRLTPYRDRHRPHPGRHPRPGGAQLRPPGPRRPSSGATRPS